MGLLIVPADFTGKYKIAQNVYSDLSNYIAKYEEPYLCNLLGVDLFNLFKADVAAFAPVSAIYLSLFNVIRADDGGSMMLSNGMKEMLVGFIYWEYMREMKFYSTPSGTVVGQSELSRETSGDENRLYDRYNQSIQSYRVIQWFIGENSIDYPLYNGQRKQLANWI